MNQFEKQKKTVYDFICDTLYTPMKIKEIAIILQVSKAQRSQLEDVLESLIEEGKIQISKRGKYSKAEKKLYEGTYLSTQHDFGFVSIEGEDDDIFISKNHVNGAMNKDLVQLEILPGNSKGKRKEGNILKILERGTTEVVGTFEKSKTFGFVRPDNPKFEKDIFVPVEDSMGAVTGHKVVVTICDYGTQRKKPEGKVIEIIGHVNDPGTDILSLAKAYGLPMEFSEKIKNQVQRVAKDVSENDCAGRIDLRNWQMVTIDGEDAKDLDDAVSVTFDGTYYTLGVHIADVSNYVQENSALDVEALKRGTSVYLVDRVIPMLPFELSNGICSLNAGVDRLALSCIMKIDKNGTVVDHEIAESVIRVDERMTYTSVKKILTDDDVKEKERYANLIPMFEQMEQLASILRQKRHERGSIDFDLPETKIFLDDQGKPVEIKPYDRNVATKLIEDFMLAANETVAEHFFWQQSPFVYRTHETPDPEKILKLETFIQNFGYGLKIKKDEIHPKELQKLLVKIEDTPEESLISRLALRSMKQAKYTVECTGHFGLAASYYCHFTSPIRRYPDLQIHRIIKEHLRGRMVEARVEHYNKILPEVAKQSSERERRADEAERETNKLKKAEYMEERIGQVYEGVISGITNWGIYVELENTIEGMIRITDLNDDYYIYSESTYELVGEHTKKCYKLGQRLKIRVASIDKMLRTIDFELADA